jgi:hypothetical protein
MICFIHKMRVKPFTLSRRGRKKTGMRSRAAFTLVHGTVFVIYDEYQKREKMVRIIMPFIVLMLLVSPACGPSVSLYSDTDSQADFSQYKTYNFIDFSEGNKETITGMELERIRVAFAKEIERRGLSYSEEDGDVSVKITVYHRQAARGYGYGGIYHHMERAVSVDMYDNQSRKHVWHCAAVGELEYDPEQRAAGLPELAARIFERYPVPAPGSS